MDGYLSNAKAFSEAASEDDRFRWLARLDYDDVDLNGLETCLEAGASGLKLHNKPVIEDAVDPLVWHSEAWHDIFDRIGEADVPILWHVTQRHTDSPYTGGGRHSYWETGWHNGAEFDNRDLMQSFLSVVETTRRISSAHTNCTSASTV